MSSFATSDEWGSELGGALGSQEKIFSGKNLPIGSFSFSLCEGTIVFKTTHSSDLPGS